MIIFNGVDDLRGFELTTVGVKKRSFLDEISALPCLWTMYVGYFVLSEVKRTYIMKENLINKYMMSREKFQTNCGKSAFLLFVWTFPASVAMCSSLWLDSCKSLVGVSDPHQHPHPHPHPHPNPHPHPHPEAYGS